MRQTALKRSVPLKSHKPINRVSKKQAKRNRTLANIAPPADGLCEKCHNPPDFRGLAKHHKQKRSNCGSDNRDNISWLCGKCHSEEHGIKEAKP